MVTQSIPLVADLRTQNRNIGTIYLATGLVTEGDTGGGIYFWNPASTNADDGFYYIQVTGVATGRWVRIYAGSNIYNTDGSLLDNRDVTLNGSYLSFIGSSSTTKFNADGSVTVGSLSGVSSRIVVANAIGTLGTQAFVPGTTIRFVEKFTATAGQTTFNTVNTLYNDLFDVFLNGVKLNDDSFNYTANQIVLDDASYVGDIIDVIGFSSATVYATLPSQVGNAGKYLTTDGTNLSWAAITGGFVPYTGATATVDLGDNDLEAGSVFVEGTTGTGGALRIKQFASSAANLDGYSTISTLNTGVFYFTAATTSPNFKNFVLNPSGLTDNTLRTYTLPNLSGTLALLSDITPGLTSVGLSMPSAFAVSNSPLTSNGTIAVTGAGTSSQYIRGDGQLANFPTNGGGGSSVNYYLNGSVNQGTFGGDTYYEMSKTPILGAGTDFTRTNAQGNGYIASFITDAGDPSLLNIPGGNWNLEFYFQSSASGGSPQFYGEIYKVSSSNVFTLVASGSTNPEGITNGTTVDQYFTSIPVPQTSLLVTDRLAIRIYVITSGRTITLHTEDGNLCEVLTTLSTGLNALNGLTSQVQYFATGTSGTDFAISSATDTHTFNLPTASATNRGALSSADWSTFSGKVSGSGASGQVAYWNGTNSQTGSNNLFWDAANSRLGVRTNTPLYDIDLGSVSKNTNSIVNTATDNARRAGFSVDNGSENRFFAGYVGSTSFNGATGEAYIGSPAGYNFVFGLGNSIRAKLFSTGNLVLQNGGTFTDGGQRLQVMGDAFIKGSGATSATSALTIQDSAGNSYVRAVNSQILEIGTNDRFQFSSGRMAHVTSGGSISNFQVVGGNIAMQYSTINIGTNSYAPTIGFSDSYIRNTTHQSFGSYVTFNPTSGTATYFSLVAQPTINQTGGANGITRGLHVNPTLTSAANWRSVEWSNNTGWGLYGEGTANNYLGGSLGIGSTGLTNINLRIEKNITGNTVAFNIGAFGTVLSDVTNQVRYVATSINTQAASFTLGNAFHFYAEQGTIGLGSSITNQYGFFANNTIIGATNNYGFYGNIPSGTNRWNLFMDGTADNYLRGKLLINTTTVGTFNLDVNGTARVSGASTFGNRLTLNGVGTSEIYTSDASGLYLTAATNGGMYLASESRFLFRKATSPFTEYMRVESTGNLLVGTTTDVASSKVTISSTTQGFLPPRMTNAQRTAISSPAVGLMVYQTDSTEGTYEYISSGWRIINGGGGGGSVDELQVALISQVFG